MTNGLEITKQLNASVEIEASRSESDSLLFWAQQYWQRHVMGSPAGTQRAKKNDLQLFLAFFERAVGDDEICGWTPSVTKAFKTWLQKPGGFSVQRRHSKPYAPTSVNRILATLRHFSNFVNDQQAFQFGSPFEGVRDLVLETPEWKGLTEIELTRLRSALDQIYREKHRANQSPDRNFAIFQILLATGLRISEMVGVDFDQYQGKYLRKVRGKGDHFEDVFLASDARSALDQYIANGRGTQPGPLLCTISGNRLSRQQIDVFLRQVAARANSRLKSTEKIALHAHRLRHTSVKRVYDQRGPLAAKRFSRHKSYTHLERYAAQTREEHEEMLEELFD